MAEKYDTETVKSLANLQSRAEQIRRLYTQLNVAQGHHTWSGPDTPRASSAMSGIL